MLYNNYEGHSKFVYTFALYLLSILFFFTFNSLCTNKSHNKLFLSIENETLDFIISRQSIKHVFPFQADFYQKKKKILHRVRKKSKRSILKRRKKAHQKEERARDGSPKLKEKEIRRKIMQWLEKAGSQRGSKWVESGLAETALAGVPQSCIIT